MFPFPTAPASVLAVTYLMAGGGGRGGGGDGSAFVGGYGGGGEVLQGVLTLSVGDKFNVVIGQSEQDTTAFGLTARHGLRGATGGSGGGGGASGNGNPGENTFGGVGGGSETPVVALGQGTLSSISGAAKRYGQGGRSFGGGNPGDGGRRGDGSTTGTPGQMGVLILRYPGHQRASGGAVTTIDVGGASYTVHTISSSGLVEVLG